MRKVRLTTNDKLEILKKERVELPSSRIKNVSVQDKESHKSQKRKSIKKIIGKKPPTQSSAAKSNSQINPSVNSMRLRCTSENMVLKPIYKLRLE